MLKKYPKIDYKKCKACCACVDVCPTSAIVLGEVNPKNKRRYPNFASQQDCILCNRCVQDCPVNAIII